MRKFRIGGMSCAACSSRVEKAVGSLSDIDVCSVNLLTGTMTVEGKAEDTEIIKTVEKAGYYVVSDKNEKKSVAEDEFTKQKKRLAFSVLFTLALMYFSMGHTMWKAPVFSFLEGNGIGLALVQLILSSVVLLINKKFFINGYKAVKNLSPNMDTLVSLGSGVSYVYSIAVIFVMTTDLSKASHLLHELYFESAAMILTLITVGKLLEEYSKGKTTSAIESLIKLSPKTATVIVDGEEVVISADELKPGDVFVLKPGAKIPADGVVIDGTSSVDESALTGESIPADKEIGSKVSAATINLSGYLKCEAQKVGEDTSLSAMIRMVNEASESKAPIAKTANKVSAVFVPCVLFISLVTTVVWLLLGESVSFSLARGITVLVVSCPCALGLATPVAIMVGNGVAAKHGILFKTAEALEETGRVKTVVLDKTGTVTEGKPVVTDVMGANLTELSAIAYSLEYNSEHPIAKAIVDYALKNNVTLLEIKDFKSVSANGVEALADDQKIYGGKISFAEKYASVDENIKIESEKLTLEGKTVVCFGKGENILGIFAVADSVRSDSAEGVERLKKSGVDVVMLTGDNRNAANMIAKEANIDTVVSELLPNEKVSEIRKIKTRGKVIMAGDGINDAPALATADVGMAIGAGTDIAIDSADVVLARNSICDIAFAVKLSRAVLRNIKENLFWAFCYNIIGIPLAAGVFIKSFNVGMNPMFGAAAMSISSFLVVSNSLRLSKIKPDRKENKIMEITLKIEGMMCPHCEARVKQKLEEADGVTEVNASHEKGTAVIRLSKDIPVESLIKIVEDQGYKVI